MADYDLAIIGGGINGTGLARDAAGRGLRVLLVEQNDLASGTSSASSKLIHGGLRYLEHGAFRLVREALHEREVLLRMAPHVIRPLRFMLPQQPGKRSALWLRFGLFIYDMLGGRKLLQGTRTVDLTHNPLGAPLQRSFRYGFEFSDCLADDSRLVVLNAMDAAERGADIRTRTRCIRADRRGDWELVLSSRGRRDEVSARVLVNAAGPWIGEVADTVIRRPLPAPARLVKGSHIVVPRRFEHDAGYLLQADDGRVVFVLPFAQDFTLIGTTDENFVGDLNSPAPDPGEVLYLCKTVNEYFRDKITPDELVWSFAGVRSLYDDGANKPEDVTRDYALALDEVYGEAPLLTIYGGKITTYRRLAEAAMERIGIFFGALPRWTAGSSLPGGDFPMNGGSDRPLAIPRRAACAAVGARLWQAHRAIFGASAEPGRSGPAHNRRSYWRRGALSRRERVGAERRRRVVAAQQARAQGHARRAQHARPVHCIATGRPAARDLSGHGYRILNVIGAIASVVFNGAATVL
jgi:glycerol-3-phosphate dehydrogenase